MHGVAKRKVAPATSDITEMVYLVASDTRLVRWRSRACYVLGYTLNRRFGRVTACYIEMAQVTPTQMTTHVGLDDTCYPNPDDDTCRVGCYIEMTLKLPPLRW